MSWPRFFARSSRRPTSRSISCSPALFAPFGPDALTAPAITVMGGRVRARLLLQRPDVRDDRLRAGGAAGARREPAGHRRGAGRADVSGARHRTAVRAVRPSDGVDRLQPQAVVAPYTTAAALQFRIANRRRNEIIELEAQVLFSYLEPDGRGRPRAPIPRLPLERNKVMFFPLAWTIVHPIDRPARWRRGRRGLSARGAEILVLLSGIDETSRRPSTRARRIGRTRSSGTRASRRCSCHRTPASSGSTSQAARGRIGGAKLGIRMQNAEFRMEFRISCF